MCIARFYNRAIDFPKRYPLWTLASYFPTLLYLSSGNFVITLALLHPTKQTPIQTWTFDSQPVVRIGRSRSNDVVIASAIVSRYHVELWRNDNHWEVVSFGANGTFVEGDRIHQVPVVDGMIVHLGNSGPQLRLQLGFHPKKGVDLPSDESPPDTEPPVDEIDSQEEE
jgi:pSer/pThr/pTyr-binding forkhead associated (FHA) protein